MIKKALVTGGARGIGESICRALSEDGWYLYIHCNSSIEEANELCAELGNAEAIVADLSNADSVAYITEKCADVDAIINNAGVALVSLFDMVSDEAMRRLFEINLFSPINIVRGILPKMLSRKKGVIINVSSVFGEVGGSCEVDYSTTKAALIGFTKALAKELGPSGITVNAIASLDIQFAADYTGVLKVGETLQLEPSYLGKAVDNLTYTYAVDNAAVATVDASGLVKAVSNGTAVITITSSNGKSLAIGVTVDGLTEANKVEEVINLLKEVTNTNEKRTP